jgi:hypothetical protein
LRIAAHRHLRRFTSRKRNSALPDLRRYFVKSGESRFKMLDAGETRIIAFTISLVVQTVVGGHNVGSITLQPTLGFMGEVWYEFRF